MMQIDFRAPPTISKFMLSDARRRAIKGPFGSGKSSGCVIEILRRAAQQKRGPDGLRHSRWAIVRNTMPQLRDTTIKTWFQWVPNGSIGYYKETGKTFYITEGDIRAEVMFRALDDAQDVKNLLSLELTGAWINECREVPREIIEALDGRIGRFPALKDGGPSWIGMWGDTNPPEEFSYWYNLMEGLDAEGKMPVDEDNGWISWHQPSGLSAEAENIENLPGGREYYVNLAKGKTKEFVKAYVHGQYAMQKSGKPVHPTFDQEIHVSKNYLIPNPHLPLIIGADFGLTPAMTLKQQDTFGRVLTFDEIVTENMGLKRAIKLRLKPLLHSKYEGFNIIVTGDPSGSRRADADETSCKTIFKEAGFKRVKFAVSNSRVMRIGATDSFLSMITEQGPAYLLDPRVSYLKRGMAGGYHWKVNKQGVVSDDPEKNIYSHVCEGGQYADMWFERTEETPEEHRLKKALIESAQGRRGMYTKRA